MLTTRHILGTKHQQFADRLSNCHLICIGCGNIWQMLAEYNDVCTNNGHIDH